MAKALESAKEAKDKAVGGGGRAASRKGPAQGGDGIGARTSGDVSAEMTIQDVEVEAHMLQQAVGGSAGVLC